MNDTKRPIFFKYFDIKVKYKDGKEIRIQCEYGTKDKNHMHKTTLFECNFGSV